MADEFQYYQIDMDGVAVPQLIAILMLATTGAITAGVCLYRRG